MKARDGLGVSALLGMAGLLLLLGVADARGDRVVNANEPVVLFDDITKRARTVESRSFPPRSVPSSLDPGPGWGDEEAPTPAPPRPTFDDSTPGGPGGWTATPPTAGPGGTRPSSPPRTGPRDPRRPSEAREPSATAPPPGGDTAADGGPATAGTGGDRDEGSTTSLGSLPSGTFRSSRPGLTTGEVTVTTGDGSVGTAEIESADPDLASPEVSFEP
jgi:hypothetical protein